MEITTYTVTEGVNKGLSKMIRDTEENGIVMIKRDGVPVVMMLALGSEGYWKFLKTFNEMTDRDIATQSIPADKLSYVYLMKGLLNMQNDFMKKKENDQSQVKLFKETE